MSDVLGTSASLVHALATAGLTWTDLCLSASEIILFGSRAAGLAREGSDWDLLCVGHGRSLATPGLDLVWVSPSELTTPNWLTGELAGHVAAYGRSLRGDPTWMDAVVCGPDAATRKTRCLTARLAAVERAWPLFTAPYRYKHLDLIRRDLQRFAMLARGEPVPPSPCLDAAWHEHAKPEAELLALARAARLDTPFLTAQLAPRLGAPALPATSFTSRRQ